MKIISEQFSTREITIHKMLKSCLQYRTEIDIGEEHPWIDIVRKNFDLNSTEFKEAVKNPEEFIQSARRITQAGFFRHIGNKLFKEWNLPTWT